MFRTYHFQCLVLYVIGLVNTVIESSIDACKFLMAIIFIQKAKIHQKLGKSLYLGINLTTISFIITFLILFSISLTCCAPLYEIFFTDENDMIISVLLPFTDLETQNVFYIYLANQLNSSLYGVVIAETELITCALKNSVSVIVVIIESSA